MDPQRIYTRKTMGLDNRVWRFMIAMIILPLALLSYRLTDEVKCVPFSFTMKTLGIHTNDVFYTGETISFTSSSPSKDIMWDFGDNAGSSGATVHHQYLKEGKFKVSASSNSLCETEREITIQNPPLVIPQSTSVEGVIVGPQSAYTLAEQIFTFSGPATYYEWSVLNRQDLGNKTGQTVKYTFVFAGKYTVQVELDHDRNKRYFFEVVVQDAVKTKSANDNVDILVRPIPPPVDNHDEQAVQPPKPATDTVIAPPKPSGPIYLADGIFLAYLQKVQNNEMAAADFEKYGITTETPVSVNSKRNKKKNFKELCEDLSEKRGLIKNILNGKIKLKSAKLLRNNGVVTIIEVDYK